MGEIFAARDETLNWTVALKLIAAALLDDGHARRRFLREARAAAALQHPFICTIHEVLEVGALAERPNLNEGFDRLGVILFHVGLIDEAQQLFQRAQAISPDDPSAARMLGTVEALRGNYAACVEMERAALARTQESWGFFIMAFSQIRLGDLHGAEETIDAASRLFPSLALFDGLRAEVAALATLGRNAEALTWLRSGVRNGFPCLAAVEGDPLFAPLRLEPDYGPLVAELRSVRDYHRQVLAEGRGAASGG